MLNERQEIVYVHSFHVFREEFTSGGTGKTSRTGWNRIATAAPGLYGYTQNDDDPSGAGRAKRRTQLTEDHLECEVTTDLKSGDMVVDVSLMIDGSHSLNYGTVHHVQGQPRKYPDQGEMELNYLTVQLMSVEANEIPAGVGP
jgi:hypothetical protein